MTQTSPSSFRGPDKTERLVCKGAHQFFPKDRTKSKSDPKARYKKRRKRK